MKLLKNARSGPWFFPLFFAAVGLVMFVITVCLRGVTFLLFLQFFSCMAAPFAVPVLGLLTKREFSSALSFCMGLLAFFGLYLERMLFLYDVFAGYDKVLHTNFGLIGAAVVYCLMLRWRGDKMSCAGVIVVIMLSTLGLGAAWELFEYSTSMFTMQDPQVWHETVNASIAAGEIVGNPLKDTMQDMLVTVIGSAAFCILYITDSVTGADIFRRIFGEPACKNAAKAGLLSGRD